MTKPDTNTTGEPKPYTGPPEPIPTHVELISDKAERVIFLLFAVFLAVYFYVEG
jgi:hypothetical protein